MKNYYTILGVSETASHAEIKSAYKRLVLQYHPDRNSSPDAADKFIAIKEAYDVLGDAEAKGRYDYSRKMQAENNYYQQQSSQQYSYPPPHSGPRYYSAQQQRKHRSSNNYWYVPFVIMLLFNLAKSCTNNSSNSYTYTNQFATKAQNDSFLRSIHIKADSIKKADKSDTSIPQF